MTGLQTSPSGMLTVPPKHWPLEVMRQANVGYPERLMVSMIAGEPQRKQRAERLRARLEPRRRVAQALELTGMRVPVYFHELAVAVRVALFGFDDELAQAMGWHNEHLVKSGVKGDFETAP